MRVVAVGGSDAGISAALRARELDPGAEVTVVAADRYPNFSICGIPYLVSGDVPRWQSLAHRTVANLEAAGLQLRLDTTAQRIDAAGHRLAVVDGAGREAILPYDALIVGTGALPIRPSVEGLVGPKALGPADGVHLMHSMTDALTLVHAIEAALPARAVIVGAGYIGLEMAEAFVARGIHVTQLEQLPEVLPTVDDDIGALVRRGLFEHGVEVRTASTVFAVRRTRIGAPHRLSVHARSLEGMAVYDADVVLFVVGVRPDATLAAEAGAALGARGALAVDRQMRTVLRDVFAAGDCAVTHHRLLGTTYLPLGTTAHKQGRIAGENAVGGSRTFAGVLGTQVVKVFDLIVARTGLRNAEARAAGFDPLTVVSEADDHKAYYPGSRRLHMRYTGDRRTGRILGLQLAGRRPAEIAKRIDVAAAAIFHEMTIDELNDLDLSYAPPLGTPWDAIQVGAQAWLAARVADRLQPGKGEAPVGSGYP